MGSGVPKVLVVEDESLIARLIERVLGDTADVEHAPDGHAAIDRLLSGSYDVVVCDLKVPGVDGASVHAAALELRPDLAKRFVFITGWPPEHVAQLRLDPRVPVIAKPFSAAALTAAMSRVEART